MTRFWRRHPTSAARRCRRSGKSRSRCRFRVSIAGCFLVFIPVVGEFVIPDLLGGSETEMIGKVMWDEFFNTRDWPLGVGRRHRAAADPGRADRHLSKSAGQGHGSKLMRRLSWFNVVSLTLAFAFLYIPILLLVVYSFNDGPNVAIWTGWSTKWYSFGIPERAAHGCRLGHVPYRVPFGDARNGARHAGGHHFDPLWPLSRFDAVQRHGLCAAGHARDHSRSGRCCCCSSPSDSSAGSGRSRSPTPRSPCATSPSSCNRGSSPSTGVSRKRRSISARRR